MLKQRHRLFRRRTRWDLVRENLHVIVTAAALIATAFAWSAISDTDQPPLAQVASTDPETSPPTAPASSSSIAEEAAPTPTAPPARSQEQTEPPPKAQPLLPEHARPSPLADVSPGTARPSQLAHATEIGGKHRLARVAQAPQAHPTPPHARHHLGRKSSAVTAARATKSHRRASQHLDGGSGHDPFDCSARNNKPPCFDVARPTISGRR